MILFPIPGITTGGLEGPAFPVGRVDAEAVDPAMAVDAVVCISGHALAVGARVLNMGVSASIASVATVTNQALVIRVNIIPDDGPRKCIGPNFGK